MTRLVKMTFEKDNIEDFLMKFDAVKQQIRAFPGLQYLELWQDKSNPEVFFTYSVWDKEASLENYRNSDLFKAVWRAVKPLFADKAEAWSVIATEIKE